ncbi:uncharacterized protein LOC114518092 [Dendronephthya gigantea]|uniref:uncharacterized protein LOC114518092 n=1 Tax=Dendronephthya gigantea TaxID=151771 RepID=UPI00106B52A3|nr:uncharacterized protein LOC114518092 [Dendronephthya gigantea]
MAGVQSGQDGAKQKRNVDIEVEILRDVVVSEGGKVDASHIRKKYKDKCGKSISKKTKIANFVKEHMSDDFEVTQERSATFIKLKTKNKDESRNAGLPSCKRKPPDKTKEVPKNRMERDIKKTGTDAVVEALSESHLESHQDDMQTSMKINRTPLASTHIVPNLPTSLKENPTRCYSKKSLEEDTDYQHEFPSLQNSVQTIAASHSPTYQPLPDPKPLRKTSRQVHDISSKAKPPSEAAIKSEVTKIIDELSKNHYVEVDMVIKSLHERFQVQSKMGLGNYRKEDIPGVKDLVRKQREINASIQAFVMVRSVSTLHELGKYLASLYSGAEDYQDLKLGPLVKHPLVYEHFRFPSNLDPPEITTLRVMKYLKLFMGRNGWTNRVDTTKFLEYLTEQMSCETPYELGVKIGSVALIIKCIKGCCSSESATRREAEKKLMDEIADDIEQQMAKKKKKLLGSSKSDPDALVNKFLDLSPVVILQKLFAYCEDLFQGKVKKKVTEFVMMCNNDRPSRKLFQLALHKACNNLVKPVEEFPQKNEAKNTVDVDKEASQTKMNESLSGKARAGISCPKYEKLFSEVKRWLVGKSSKSVDVKQLARVEERILHCYKGFTTFSELGHGSFIQFLSTNKELEALICFSVQSDDKFLGIKKSDVIDLIQQCGVDSEKKKLHKIVHAQYRNLSTSLDEKSLDALVARAREQGIPQHDKIPVVYEACLVAETLDTAHVQGSDNDKHKKFNQVGVLGHQNLDNVLVCLYQTPLLEDFLTWSEWLMVFEPIYGNIKSFLRKNLSAPNPIKTGEEIHPCDLVAIETPSGSLLRITRLTSTDIFLTCAKRGDVIGTSGHLVSLVFQYGGVKKAPLALLASHMKEAFLFLYAEADEESAKYVIRFAIRCLSRVPRMIRCALAMEIFIEPLKFVFGNTQTQEMVLKYCETFDEKAMFHFFGINFGVLEWKQDFMKKFEFIKSFDVEEEDGIIVGEEIKEKKLEHLNNQVKKESLTDEKNVPLVDEIVSNNDDTCEFPPSDEYTECPVNSISSAREQECQAVVDSIRRDEFGIGIEFPPEHRQMMENQRSREGRGLHRLSSELYSKDTHFVLELVQNADDNRYNDSLTSPSIAFFVNVDRIEVFNNEVGFEERNIRALCDVGKSTKGKQRFGYIGQKGIGFKSVFRITDTPEVHSNGYHIRFDAKSGPTGYILPHWWETKTDPALNDWTTRIVLPLKDDMKDAQKKTLIARFHDIQPSLLLFLRRLRKIKIHDEASNTTREMSRRDCGDKLIEITHSEGVDLWFVVKKELSASAMKDDIESTEIAIAFPLPPRHSGAPISLENVKAFTQGKSLAHHPVFAFLPLRSYGFRFIIQADFDVPSSREDVDKDSAWNQWLRQEIAGLFVQAFDDFKSHECFLGVASIVQLLQFIPLKEEILDFFKPVTHTIHSGLARKQCIPVLSKHPNNNSMFNFGGKTQHPETTEDDEVEIKWVFPSQVVIAEDYLIEELISDEILNRYLNKYYLHPDLRLYLHAPLCRVLGIETVSCQHLIDIGKIVASEIELRIETQPEDTPQFFEEFTMWAAKWLCGVYRCLERERDCSDETLEKIAQIKIFPLSRGQCTPIFGQSVFLPLQDKIKGENAKNKASRGAADIVHRELHSLHPLILESLDDIRRSEVKKLLERLQVKCLTSYDLIKHHIIPDLKKTQDKSVSRPDVLFSYIVYIKDQWDLDPSVCDLQELRSCALVKTNKGFVNPSLEPVHFTVKYGNKTNLEKDFSSVTWTMIDNGYFISAKELHNSWEKFLLALGVVHFLAIERKDVTLSKSIQSNSVWSSLKEFWSQTPGSYIVKDYASSELETLLSFGSDEELKRLAELLDQHWDEIYSKYAKDVPYLDEQGKVLGQTSSSFFLNLKEKSWLPTKSQSGSKQLVRCCPRDAFMHKPEIIELLGDHALYAGPSLVNENFLKVLGIQTSVKFDTLVAELMKWIGKDHENEDSGFVTTLDHMTNVYIFLDKQIKANDERKKYLEVVTKNKSVVFVPSVDDPSHSPSQSSCCKIRGTFLPSKRMFWEDPSNLMQVFWKGKFVATDPRRMLNSYYQNVLKNFFVDFLGIDESPNLKEYLNLLEEIASESSLASGPNVDNIMRVYDVIATKCLVQGSTRSTDFVKSQLLNLRVFPTEEENWVSLEDKPLFCDDKFLKKLFGESKSQNKEDMSEMKKKEEKVHFVKMGLLPKRKEKRKEFQNEEKKNSRIRNNVEKFFREVCDICSLSECVTSEIISSLSSDCPALQSFLFRWIPFIQRFIYTKDPVCHDKLQESGMANTLSNVKCFASKELEVVYRLRTHPKITVSVKKNCGIENSNGLKIYVIDEKLGDTKDLIKELAKFFVPPENVGNLSNFLDVLTQKSEKVVEEFMEDQELDCLPDDLTEWMVPEPPPVPISMTTESYDETPSLDTMITPEQPTVTQQETSGELRGLQCWPPRAPGTHIVSGSGDKNPATEQVLAAWPLPAPPDAYVSPRAEAQAQTQHDPRLLQDPMTQYNSAIQPKYVPAVAFDETTVDESHLQPSQPTIHIVQSQPDTAEFSTEVIANVTYNTANNSMRVSGNDVTHLPHPQYVRPLELNDVRVELEEIELKTAFKGTELVSLPQSANAEEIGRWGEECVYTLLKSNEKNDEVTWVNERHESGLPYDIVIKADSVEKFIEVKSTSTSEKRILEISSKEIMCAFQKRENYHLYRVYNAGSQHYCRVARLCNLASSLDAKSVSLFILI